MTLFMDCCGATDIGRQRSNNEDQFLIADVCRSMRVHRTSLALDHQTRLFGGSKAKLLLVADGMGGHESGERASQLVIDGFVDYVLNHLSWFLSAGQEHSEQFEEQLIAALVGCQNVIDREVQAIPQRRGMGSTLTLGYLVWPQMYLVHVGDTRCYLLRDAQLQQLTRDHTLAAALHAAGTEEATGLGAELEDENETPFSNILWNVIGGHSGAPHPDASAHELKVGDTIIFATDGLTKHVSKSRISEIASQEGLNASEICRALIDEANNAGGSDNITVVVGRFCVRQPEEVMECEISRDVDDPGNADTTPMLATPAT